MAQGNPRCITCHGRGGYRDGFGWRRCHCMRPVKAVQDVMRKANQRDGRPFQLPLDGLAAKGR